MEILSVGDRRISRRNPVFMRPQRRNGIVSSPVPVNELVLFKVIFGKTGVIPSSQKVLIKGEVKAADVGVVLEHISRHSLNV